MHKVPRLLAILFVVAIPVLLVASSVTYAFNELRLYEYGFKKYEVSQDTGISDQGLKSSARQIREYFNSRDEPLAVRVEVYGQEQELFTPREVAHMRDVKHLLWGVYGVGAAVAALIISYIVARLLLPRGQFGPPLARLALWGSGATVALVIGVGLASLVGFDRLFLWFHQVSFGNDFWRLDPSRHFLVMMFPQGFWRDATLFVGFLALGQAFLLGAISAGWIWWRQRTARHSAIPITHPSQAAND